MSSNNSGERWPIARTIRQELLTQEIVDPAKIDQMLQSLVDIVQQTTIAELQTIPPTWEQERSALQSELVQAQSLIHGQGERICHLEQALDQTLGSLHDLRLQLVDQQLLEAHLASTEEISNVQQQAIAQLKHQLAQQQANLTPIHPTSPPHQDDQCSSLVTPQQQQIAELEAQILADRTLIHQLETQLEQAHHQIQDLSQQIRDRQTDINQLETDLHRAHLALQEQQGVIDGLQRGHSQEPCRPASSPSPLLPRTTPAGNRREEAVLLPFHPGHPYTVLQHACQELEVERNQAHQRVGHLEHQIADMQEQILQQAQQASEYETAIQHWKERYRTTQTHLRQLRQLMDQLTVSDELTVNEELHGLVVAVQDSLQAIDEANQLSQRAAGNHRGIKIDLPEFLVRRRPRISS